MKNNLGILGGGQLGMFICQAAKKYKIKTTVFSQSKNFSAKGFCDNFLVGSFTDKNLLDQFINSSDFFTIETENIPISVLKKIEKKKKYFHPPILWKLHKTDSKKKNF